MFRQGPHVLLWVWWRKGLFRQGSPLRRMIFLITPPRRGEGGGGGEPGSKGYVFWSGAEGAFTRALFSFVWMTLFFLCQPLSFVDTMYPTNVHSNGRSVMCIDSRGELASLGGLYVQSPGTQGWR